jgi:inorganic pyrophosphatase/exopolyphosphatase
MTYITQNAGFWLAALIPPKSLSGVKAVRTTTILKEQYKSFTHEKHTISVKIVSQNKAELWFINKHSTAKSILASCTRLHLNTKLNIS